MLALSARGTQDFYWLLPTWIVATLLEAAFLGGSFKNGLGDRLLYPFAPWFAMRVRNCPLLLRPLAAAWWAAHFLIGIAAAIFFDNLIVADHSMSDGRLARCVVFVAIDLTIAYSANLYGLLAVTAAGGGDQIVQRVWRWRIALDLGVAITAAFFPMYLPRR